MNTDEPIGTSRPIAACIVALQRGKVIRIEWEMSDGDVRPIDHRLTDPAAGDMELVHGYWDGLLVDKFPIEVEIRAFAAALKAAGDYTVVEPEDSLFNAEVRDLNGGERE